MERWCKMVLVICILTGCNDNDLTLPIYEVNEAKHTKEETEIVNGLNDYRVNNGFTKLATDQTTQELAQEHSVYMAEINEVTHEGFSSRHLELTNKGAFAVGEIVGGGYATTEAVVKAWLNSQDHNKIITGNFSHCGVSIIDKKYTVIFINTSHEPTRSR